MEHGGIWPDSSTYAYLLQDCIKRKALTEGKVVHTHINQTGIKPNIILGNRLVIMYSKFGSLDEARRVLDDMPERNVVTWTIMIGAYVRCGYGDEALRLFYQMQRVGIQLDQFAFTSLLPACANLASLEHGQELHGSIVKRGFQLDVCVGTALVDMYAKCERIENARQVFDKMPIQNVVSWNAMISGYVRNSYIDEALDLFQKMPERNVVSWTAMIAGYAQIGNVDEALNLFQKMPERNVVSWNAMIAGFMQNGRLNEAMELFQLMPERNVASWNAVITGFAQFGNLEKALKLFLKMPERNVVSWTTMIAGYAQNGHLNGALQLFQNMPERNVISWNAMIAGFAKNGHLDEALKLFQKMPERNVVSWNEIIEGFAQNGQFDEAIKLFEKMPKRNVVSWTVMIAGYAQHGHVKEALNLFQKMPEKHVVSWNAMIAGFAQNGYFDDAVNLFQQMQLTDIKPDSNTFASVLSACANLVTLEQGKEAHEAIIRCGFQSDIFVGTALVDMYAKCGIIEDARIVFDKMPRQNVVAWNAMITGSAMHGFGMEALQLFERMQQSGSSPDHVTFVGVLSACCHAGLVHEGWQFFDQMSRYYHITPTVEHYCCMVDLLGRAGYLVEAQDFINKMPIKPNAVVWGSLLGACRIYNNIEIAEHVAERLFQLDPENAALYVLLSNIYALAGRWDDIGKVRKLMKDRRLKKKPGCSWIEFNNKVNTFFIPTTLKNST
eukprot:Gb_27416 [translate_table: standard]